MPELPEVETTCRGVEPHIKGKVIRDLTIRNGSLRWPIPEQVHGCVGQRVTRLHRRGKYILADLDQGGLLMHLGMSGSMRVLLEPQPALKHDHFDIEFDDCTLRYNDPRRFGALLWWDGRSENHPLLRDLGPEPLTEAFSGDYLWQRSRGIKRAVKNFIMDSKVVVGVGNIYASEALFMSGIHPTRAAGRVSRQRYQSLALAIVDVLARAIERGGTTLRDFVSSDGAPGYFAQELLVYGRGEKPCFQCGAAIRQKTIGQRSSFYCPRCQR